MSSPKHEWEAILICPAGFFVASVGFSLSVLATIFSAIMPGTPGPPPILQIRQAAAVAASARSPPRSLSSDDHPRKETFRLIAPAPHTERGEKQQQLYIDVEGAAPLGDAKIEATLVLAPVGLSPQETKHSQHVVHFKFPVQEEIVSSPVKQVFPRAHIDTVPASPAPTHRSLHSASSHASSDVNTLSSASHSTADADATPTSPGLRSERRRSHKLRFSKLVHLFTDKHGHGQESKARRRDSVSELRAEAAPAPLSRAVPPPAEVDTAEAPARSQSTRQRPRHRSLIRTVSCPILHYTHPHERTSRVRPRSPSPPPPVPPLPAIPSSPTSPVTPRSPRRAKTQTRKASLKKEKEAVPRPRTQPYAAPYFIPPPDSVNVEEPLVRRRPSRRRTAEGLGA